MLPRTLKYVFLGPKETLPIIISAELTPTQGASLIEVLQNHKVVIGWTLSDLMGINPSICMHHIYMCPMPNQSGKCREDQTQT